MWTLLKAVIEFMEFDRIFDLRLDENDRPV